jgi:hypothetical protein
VGTHPRLRAAAGFGIGGKFKWANFLPSPRPRGRNVLLDLRKCAAPPHHSFPRRFKNFETRKFCLFGFNSSNV